MKTHKALASNEEWQAWGKLDPLYGVATLAGHAKSSTLPWTDSAFYDLGASDWNLFRTHWEQYGLQRGSCVEIGCGAGRLTVQLARYFETVHGLDVSADMIAYARGHVPSNVSLHLTGGLDIPLPDNSAEAVFSAHVLQHLSSADAAAAYLREMHRVLSSGGSIMVHVPLIMWPWGTMLGAHKLLHRLKTALDAARVRLGRYAFRHGLTPHPPMQVIWYEMPWLHRQLLETGFGNVEFRILLGGSKMAVQHPFIFAMKP